MKNYHKPDEQETTEKQAVQLSTEVSKTTDNTTQEEEKTENN